MRLFHVSEESNILEFLPRTPDRNDLDKNVGLVWAINEKGLPNFLTPRNCPRVAYRVGDKTTQIDKALYFSSPTQNHAVVIEAKWLDRMRNTTLYLYEFNPDGFEIQDDVAGYYVSTDIQRPIEKFVITDLLMELIRRNVEIRFVDNLWSVADNVKSSTLNWSLCRMAFAQPRL